MPTTTQDQSFTQQERKAAWQNVFILMIAGSIMMAGAPLIIGSGGLTAQTLLAEREYLATLPITTYNIGIALGAIPAAMLTQRLGRRLGFIVGAIYFALVCLIGATSIIFGSFIGFSVATLLMGSAHSMSLQFRFAVADVGDDAFKARAMSIVMLGGIGAAVIGPQIIIHAQNLIAPFTFAGSHLVMAFLAIISALILLFYKTPKNQGSKNQAIQAPDTNISKAKTASNTGRPIGEIIRQPKFIVSTACTISAAGLMAFVMTAAPLAMVACGFSTSIAALGIQWHVISMFIFSPLTGNLIVRFGAEKVVGVGLAILIACAAVALMGIELWQFYLSLILLGMGWNFAFIGGSNLVTRTYRPEEKNKVQGFFDFLVYGFSAVASGLSGIVFALLGWNVVNLIVFPIVALAIGALIWLARENKRLAQSA